MQPSWLALQIGTLHHVFDWCSIKCKLPNGTSQAIRIVCQLGQFITPLLDFFDIVDHEYTRNSILRRSPRWFHINWMHGHCILPRDLVSYAFLQVWVGILVVHYWMANKLSVQRIDDRHLQGVTHPSQHIDVEPYKTPFVSPSRSSLSKVSSMHLPQLFRWPPFSQSSKGAAAALQVFSDWYEKDHNKTFAKPLLIITFMTIWPWVFFGIVMAFDGLAMPLKAARIANHHPQDVSFFVTSLSSVLNIVVGYLFSNAVSMLSRKYVVHKDPNIAHISFFTKLRNRSFPTSSWHQRRFRPFLTVILFMIFFIFVTSGNSALLTPVIFNRHVQLQGTELDFGATDPACVDWFSNNSLLQTCDWTVTLMSKYTTIKTDLCVCSYIGIQGCKLHYLPRRESVGRRVGCCSWQCLCLFT